MADSITPIHWRQRSPICRNPKSDWRTSQSTPATRWQPSPRRSTEGPTSPTKPAQPSIRHSRPRATSAAARKRPAKGTSKWSFRTSTQSGLSKCCAACCMRQGTPPTSASLQRKVAHANTPTTTGSPGCCGAGHSASFSSSPISPKAKKPNYRPMASPTSSSTLRANHRTMTSPCRRTTGPAACSRHATCSRWATRASASSPAPKR